MQERCLLHPIVESLEAGGQISADFWNNWPGFDNTNEGIARYISALLRARSHIPDQCLFFTCGKAECIETHRNLINAIDVACNLASAQAWYTLWQYVHFIIDPVPKGVLNTCDENIHSNAGIDFRYLNARADGLCRFRTLWNVIQHLPISINTSKYYDTRTTSTIH